MKYARRTTLIKQSGPYSVKSCANGDIIITPAWNQMPKTTGKTGGGPGLFSRLALAADLEDFLNGIPKRSRKR